MTGPEAFEIYNVLRRALVEAYEARPVSLHATLQALEMLEAEVRVLGRAKELNDAQAEDGERQ